MDVRRELARLKAENTGREQNDVKAGMQNEMNELKQLMNSGNSKSSVSLRSNSPTGGAGGTKAAAAEPHIKVNMTPNNTRPTSTGHAHTLPNRATAPPTAGVGIKHVPSPTRSASMAHGVGAGPTPMASGERRSSFKVKEKQSLYIAGGDAAGAESATGGALAVDDPRVIQEIAGLREKVSSLTKERDTLAAEKQLWMSRVQKDNMRLAAMLRNVRDAKKRLVDEMDGVQTEKAKLKSMQLLLQSNELKSSTYPLGDEDCIIGPARRELMSPQSRKESAQMLHETLLSLVSKTHANAVDVNTFVAKIVNDAIQNFIDFKPEVTNELVQQLRTIADSAPGNLKSAEEVAHSLSESMIGAVLGRSQSVLKMRANTAGFVEAEKASAEAESKDLESKSLMAQNEALKVNLAQMRKKYAQLMETATRKGKSAEAHPVVDSTGFAGDEKGGRGRAQTTSGIAPSAGGTKFRGSKSDDIVNEILASSNAKAPVTAINLFDTLPFEIKQQANALLSQELTTVVDNHPLSSSLKKHATKEVVAEVSVPMQNLLGLSLHAYKDKNIIAFDGSMGADNLESAIRGAMKTSFFQKQSTMHVHVCCTYLYQRQRTVAGGDANTDTSTLTVTATDRGRSDESVEEKSSDVAQVKKVNPKSTGLITVSSSQVHAQKRMSMLQKSGPQPLTGSDNPNFVGEGGRKAAPGNVFLASTGEEDVTTLRPPEKDTEPVQKVPAFMQPVPKKKR